ncbi:hypothetical protein LC20_06097 (plasmid) [Yersinia hibernica]|uniref:Uncharacterized protein n=2 Tax=Yersinia TaxID=629 RepID=A0A7U4K397_YEREN|nr:hypothetical protein LC20_06097 [Yersinia hibernica]
MRQNVLTPLQILITLQLMLPDNGGAALRAAITTMTKEEKFTLAVLQAFTSTDHEQYRERGEEARLRLSNAVASFLALPECWTVDCERRLEWGGVHPVHLRLSHQCAPQVLIDVIGPCHESPYWYGRMWFDGAQSVAWFYSADCFDPSAIKMMLGKINEYICAGYTDANTLAAALRMGGQSV